MKKIAFLFGIILLISTALGVVAYGYGDSDIEYTYTEVHGATNDEIEIVWDQETLKEVDSRTFKLPVSIKCVGNANCGGRIDVTFETKNSISEVNGKTHTCAITNTQKSCSLSPTFRLYRGPIGPKKSKITIKAEASATAGRQPITAESDEIEIDLKIGTPEGKITSQFLINANNPFNVKLTYTCKEGVCFGVEIAPNLYGGGLVDGEAFDCGDMDKNEKCEHTFTVTATRSGAFAIKGYAKAYNPPDEIFETTNDALILVSGNTPVPQAEEVSGAISKGLTGAFNWLFGNVWAK